MEEYHQHKTESRVYEFRYSDNIHEGMAGCISLHRTKKGAEIAMEFHKEEKSKEFHAMYDEEEIEQYGFVFGEHEYWGVGERNIIE